MLAAHDDLCKRGQNRMRSETETADVVHTAESIDAVVAACSEMEVIVGMCTGHYTVGDVEWDLGKAAFADTSFDSPRVVAVEPWNLKSELNAWSQKTDGMTGALVYYLGSSIGSESPGLCVWLKDLP